jgi:hypothetical protein
MIDEIETLASDGAGSSGFPPHLTAALEHMLERPREARD